MRAQGKREHKRSLFPNYPVLCPTSHSTGCVSSILCLPSPAFDIDQLNDFG